MDRRSFIRNVIGASAAITAPISFCGGREYSNYVVGKITECRINQRGFELTVELTEYFRKVVLRGASKEQIAIDMQRVGKQASKQMMDALCAQIW